MRADHVLVLTHWAPNLLVFRRRLLEKLLERGTRVTAAAPTSPDFPHDELRALGIETAELPAGRNSLDPFAFRKTSEAIRALVRDRKPDVVLSYSHQTNLLAGAALRGMEAPPRWIAVVTGMGRLFQPAASPAQTLLRALLSRALVRRYRAAAPAADRLLALNPDDLAKIRSWSGELARKAALLPRGEGVDLRRFRPDAELRRAWRAERGYADGDFVCAFVGRFMPEKGIGTFLDAAERDAANRSNRKWLLVGDSALGGNRAVDERIERLRASGAVARLPWQRDLLPLHNGIDLLLYPSIGEGLPIAPLEAMACGVPVLALDADGTRELAKGETGCALVFSKRPDIWIDAIEELQQGDYAAKRERAVALARRYDADLAADDLVRFLDGEAE